MLVLRGYNYVQVSPRNIGLVRSTKFTLTACENLVAYEKHTCTLRAKACWFEREEALMHWNLFHVEEIHY
jgi:hypothetical protein